MPGPRRRLRPQDRRAELLRAGEAVVRARGLGAGIDDVARAAGASRATFYVYFATWEAFLAALRETTSFALEAEVLRYESACSDWCSLIGGLPALFIRLTRGLEGLHRALYHPLDAANRETVERRPEIVARLEALLVEAVAAGAIDAGPPALAAAFLHAVCREAADRALAGEDEAAVAQAFGAGLIRAFAVRPAPRHSPAGS